MEVRLCFFFCKTCGTQGILGLQLYRNSGLQLNSDSGRKMDSDSGLKMDSDSCLKLLYSNSFCLFTAILRTAPASYH